MSKKNNGQVLLIALLAVASILVVAMSVVSESISDIKVSTQEEESIRALNAAEAGLEEVLESNSLTGIIGLVDIAQKESEYNVAVEDYGVTTDFLYPRQLSSGETATIWFKEHDNNGNFTGEGSFAPTSIRFCWGDPFGSGNFNNNPDVPALEVIFFYDDGTGIKTKTFGYDPNRVRRRSTNFEFGLPSGADRRGNNNCDFDGFRATTFKDVNILTDTGIDPSDLQFAVLRILYNPTAQYVGVKILRGGNLPAQGKKIDSAGVSGVSTRRVQLNLLYPDIPSPFVSAIVSKGGVGL